MSPSKPSTRLFHAVIVAGSTVTLPAIVVSTTAVVAALTAAGCSDRPYQGIGADLGGPADLSGVYHDIGVSPYDFAEPVDGGGGD